MIGAIFVKFRQLIVMKIIEIVATRCQILHIHVKCTKFNFGLGCAPYPAAGSLQRSPDPLAGFKGPTSKGRGGKGESGGKGWVHSTFLCGSTPMAQCKYLALCSVCSVTAFFCRATHALHGSAVLPFVCLPVRRNAYDPCETG